MTFDTTKETQLQLFVDGIEIPFPEKSSLFTSSTISYVGSASSLRRTVNGVLVSTADPAFRKLQITTSCNDRILPALAQVFPDSECEYHCPITIREKGNTPTRPYVNDSLYVSENLEWCEYRPIINGMINVSDFTEDEWQSSAGWSITVEEI